MKKKHNPARNNNNKVQQVYFIAKSRFTLSPFFGRSPPNFIQLL